MAVIQVLLAVWTMVCLMKKQEIKLSESKWCRCVAPKCGYLTDPDRGTMDPLFIEDKTYNCMLCFKPWRKRKNIKGPELIDYPIGTVFKFPHRYPCKIRLVRDEWGRIWVEQWDTEFNYWNLEGGTTMSACLFQDRFEIVEEE